jgi:HPt (histidine-containing phosphotransfer) domain-containing protein
MLIWMLEEFGAEALRTLLDMFHGQAYQLVEVAEGAVRAGDAEGAGRAAHTLTSSAATMGASGLAALCNELDVIARSGSLAGGELIAAALSPSLSGALVQLAAFEAGLAAPV